MLDSFDSPNITPSVERRLTRRMTPLVRVAAGAVAAQALLLVAMQAVLIREAFPPIVVMTALTLALAGALTRGRTWLLVVGALWSLVLFALTAPFMGAALAQPEALVSFVITALFFAATLIGAAAGLGGVLTRQRLRATDHPPVAPPWLAASLVALGGVLAGGIAVAAIPRPGVAASVSPQLLVEGPVITARAVHFDHQELRAHVGETVVLRLVNDDGMAHAFDIDALDVHVRMPPGKMVAAVFKPVLPGRYRFYCSIPGHPESGMAGTLVVTP